MSIFRAMQSNQASSDAAAAKGEARASRRSLKDMETRLHRAMLACEAMWTLMRDKLGVTDLELIERINEIDLTDGKLDGKVRKQTVACPSCGRTMAARSPKCMYCGQAVMQDPFA